MKSESVLLLVFTFCLWLPANSDAHDCFQKPMEERYGLKSVSCKTCHPNNKDRSIHNEFGKLFLAELKGKDLTKNFNEAGKKGEEAVAEYEKEMVKHFLESLKVIEKKNMTFGDLIKYGLLSGVRLEKQKSEDE